MTELSRIDPIPLADALSQRYLAYALSTITSRSLPDVRDGLKPVHRRLLYAMRQLRLDPKSGFKKCARIVGDVMGKFHPHGDGAIYEALVRLAQEFAQRYPLVDGQGNFGNIDGDNAAAMRYTEARLTEIAELLLRDIDQDTVDFRSTYDGEEQEPVVLPAAFPNLLANGSSGIAVGMATSIPPHNVIEICDALLHLIKTPTARLETLVNLIRGPDFPTGGVLVEPQESLLEAYRTGRGSFRLRAAWMREEQARGSWVVVITEMPYQVQKSKLVERIAELLQERKLPLLADVRDESAENVRLVLEPRSRTVDPAQLMETLYRATDLEVRIPLNMNVLDGGRTPLVMNLKEVLQAWLDHRQVVLVRRSRFRMGEIQRRIEVLDGYLIAYLNIDEVIRIIREEDEPKPAMMQRFGLSELQAESILNMRLRSLRRLEEIEIRREHKELKSELKGLKEMLADEGRRWTRIAEEVGELRKSIGAKSPLGRRRTQIADAPEVPEIVPEAMIEREPVTVICSEKGWIRTMKGHVQDEAKIAFKDGDRGRFLLQAETTDRLLLFATNGRFYTLAIDKLPGGRGHGEPVRLMVDLPNDQEIAALFVHRPGRRLLVAASDGRGFVVPEDQVVAQTRAGKQVLNVSGDVEAARLAFVDGDTVAVLGENRRLLLFPLDQVPEMNRGRGVTLQKYRDGGLADIKVFELKKGFTWSNGGRTRTETAMDDWLGQRAQAGRLPPKGFNKVNRFDA
ncbi:MAG: DNA topoisomerase IV subunit A [Alphaproteobacteria bacterium]|nr:DNA topoisomerase IV subunit A [Alphaproteobacteria bacterium]